MLSWNYRIALLPEKCRLERVLGSICGGSKMACFFEIPGGNCNFLAYFYVEKIKGVKMQVDKGKYNEKCANKLRSIRMQNNLTRPQMAKKLEVSANGYRKNERALNFLNLKSLEILATDFNIAMDWFLFDRGPVKFEDNTKLHSRIKALEKELAAAKQKPEMGEIDKNRTGEPLLPDVQELNEAMKAVPQLFYELMAYFHRFKNEHPEWFKTPSGKDTKKKSKKVPESKSG